MRTDINQLVSIFIDLVKLNGISKQEKAVADYIGTFLQNLGITVREDGTGKQIGGNTGNLIARISPEKKPQTSQFSLAAHMDTVQSTAGIQPIIHNGKITSDGNTILGADNRAGIALILCLVANLRRQKIPHHTFEVIFTVGEETGLYGSTHLDLNLVESRTVYILDSSADPGSYVYAAPAATEFIIDFIGKASHAAVNPEQGINALSMAGAFIHKSPVGKVDDDTTINLGKIFGGEANNVIPARATLTGEIRSFSRKKIQTHFQKLQQRATLVAENQGGKFEIRREEAFPGFILDQTSQPFQHLLVCLQAAHLKPTPLRYHGGSDANVLNNRGMVAIDLGIGAKNPHSKDEYIYIKDMQAIDRLLHHLVTNAN